MNIIDHTEEEFGFTIIWKDIKEYHISFEVFEVTARSGEKFEIREYATKGEDRYLLTEDIN